MSEWERPERGKRSKKAAELARRMEDEGCSGAVAEEVRSFLGSAPSTPGTPVAEAPSRSLNSSRVRIWQSRGEGEDRYWERPGSPPLGDAFAKVEKLTLRPPSGQRRILFFGESAAAGYLYAPHLTPAQVLSEALGLAVGTEAYQVIDLARSNERIGSLVQAVEEGMQLNPDLIVLWTGNNWSLLETPEVTAYAPSTGDREIFGQSLQADGLRGPLTLARRRLGERAAAGLAEIARACAGVPVLVVLPEVNLADWRDRQPVPWLPGDGVARWHEALDRADQALERGNLEEAIELGWEMLDLDDLCCPTGCGILAQAHARFGKLRLAREAALAEVDAGGISLQALLGAPRALSGCREILRRAALHHGFESLDLREIFAQHTGSPLPGRRLFLDYCHLTAEGMGVAMAAVAEAGLRVLKEPAIPTWQDLLQKMPGGPSRDPEADAVAFLGAAIHTAHRMPRAAQPGGIVDHWLQEALRVSPAVVTAWQQLAQARASRLPVRLTAVQHQNLNSPYKLLLDHGWSWDGLDGELLERMEEFLGQVEGKARSTELTAHLTASRSPSRGQWLELVGTATYLASPVSRFFADAVAFSDLPGRATHRSPWPLLEYHLPTRADQFLELEIVARLPLALWETGREGRAQLTLNGEEIDQVELTDRWSRWSGILPATNRPSGLQRLSIRWPMPNAAPAEPHRAIAKALSAGHETPLHPVFGEVASLRIRPGRDPLLEDP